MNLFRKEKRDNGLYVVMLLFTLFMGAGTTFFQSDNPLTNPIGFLFFLALVFYMLKRLRGIPDGGNITGIMLIVAIWTLYHWLRVGHYDLAFILLAFHIFAGYLMICLYKEKIIDYYEKVAYTFALVGLLMWVVNNVISSEVMASFAPFRSSGYNNASDSSGSFLFYVTGSWKSAQSIVLYRNQGYCWEAGRFASLTSLGLLCYIIKNNGISKIWDKHLWVYILTIFSTFSTTGYITTLIILGLTILFGKSFSFFYQALLGGLLAVAIVYLQDADFLGEKIERQLDTSSFLSQGAEYYSESGVQTVERFEGIYLDWLNFIDEPFMGYGLTDQWSYMQRHINRELITSNGITKPFAQYGIILALIYFLYLFKGTTGILASRRCFNKYLLFITLLSISISYDFNKTPLIFAFALYGIINKNKIYDSYKYEKM